MARWGIIGPPGDEQVARVASYLRERRAEPAILDLSRFPAEASLSLLDGLPVAPGLGAGPEGPWYVRSLPLPLPFLSCPGETGTATAREQESARRSAYANGRELRSFVFSFVAALERGGALLVNHPSTFGQHFLKLEQLQRLRDAAVPVPRTLATNDPAAVVDFARSIGGPIVYKPIAGGALCRRATEDDLLPERLRLLAGAPVLFQEEVPGRNLRVYVVAGKVVASYEIVSDELDYRGAETAVFRPRPARKNTTRASGRPRRASWCSPASTSAGGSDGTFALLECNPSPMFAAIERRTGESSVTRALGELLLGSMEPRPPG